MVLYLWAVLDGRDGSRIELSGICLESIDRIGLGHTSFGGVTTAAGVNTGDPAQVGVDIAGRDSTLECDNILARNDVAGLGRSCGSGSKQASEEECDAANASHCEDQNKCKDRSEVEAEV